MAFGVLVAELEDVADFYGFAEAEGLAADGVELAFVDVADVGGEGGGEVADGGDVAVGGGRPGWPRRRGWCGLRGRASRR